MKTQMVRIITFVVLTMAVAVAVAVAEYSSEQITEWHKAAEQGNLAAQILLGIAYSRGDGVTQDKREAMRWWRKAAQQGNADAQHLLGRAYYYGDGVVKDQPEAVRWWRKAAEQGHANSQVGLGDVYATGEGVAKDQREAVRWWHKAAEQGDVRAQALLGIAYSSGDGVAQDQRKAAYWYRKAAEQGDVRAQALLGIAYSLGDGVAQDQRKAVYWYRKAAEEGHATAQYFLGLLYYHGEGVTKDLREGVRWWRKAAERGDVEAQYNLGIVYSNGQGAIADYREAYIWYSIAKANGNESAADILREYNWRDYLSKSEINSALKEATRRMDATENRSNNFAENSIDSTISNVLTPKDKEVGTAAKVFEKTWRSVVVVRNGDGRGSGVIIRQNIVATNCHIVDESGGNIVYKSNDRRADTGSAFFATIRRSDEGNDFCLLDVDGLGGTPVTVRRYDTLKVGEDVYGLGSPKGLNLSLSDGLISQLREVAGRRFIQTNVAISPGSSGGGLFDSEGKLVGILTSKVSDENAEGLGFAIPADLALEE